MEEPVGSLHLLDAKGSPTVLPGDSAVLWVGAWCGTGLSAWA